MVLQVKVKVLAMQADYLRPVQRPYVHREGENGLHNICPTSHIINTQ